MEVDVGVDDRRLRNVRRRLLGDADVGAVRDHAARALADDADVLVAGAQRVRGVQRHVGLARTTEVPQDATLQGEDVGAVRRQRLGVLDDGVGIFCASAGEERGAERDTGVDVARRSRDHVVQQVDRFGAAADARQQPPEPDARIEVVGVGGGERLEGVERAQRVPAARHPLGVLVRHARPHGGLRGWLVNRPGPRSRHGARREQRCAQRRGDHRSSRPRRAMSSCGLNGLIM